MPRVEVSSTRFVGVVGLKAKIDAWGDHLHEPLVSLSSPYVPKSASLAIAKLKRSIHSVAEQHHVSARV